MDHTHQSDVVRPHKSTTHHDDDWKEGGDEEPRAVPAWRYCSFGVDGVEREGIVEIRVEEFAARPARTQGMMHTHTQADKSTDKS